MPTTIAQIVITLDDSGTVAVNGPIDQVLMCYGLLEMAKDSIRKHVEEKARRVVQAPGLGDVYTFARKS
jgi:hypothetical protein